MQLMQIMGLLLHLKDVGLTSVSLRAVLFEGRLPGRIVERSLSRRLRLGGVLVHRCDKGGVH